MVSKRRLQIFALSALTVIGMATAAPAANERRQQQPRRTLGAGVTVNQTRNALTASASVTDSAQPQSTSNRRRATRPDAARIAAHRQRVNRFVRDRVEGLRKLESYRSLHISPSNPD